MLGIVAAGWTSSGDDQPNWAFGFSVTGDCDFDGDGYADIAIGAGAESAYAFYGAPAGLSVVPDWTSSGDGVFGAGFGISVACAGDVNEDGYDDLVVGAPSNPFGILPEGKAFLYLGSPGGLSTAPAWSSTGDAEIGDEFGWTVAGVGDVNDDGRADVLVGAQNHTGSGLAVGKAYLFLGSSAGLEPMWAWTSVGDDVPGAFFSFSMAGIGDIDGDSDDDVIIAAPGQSNSVGSVFCDGKAFVFSGSVSGLDPMPSWTSIGQCQSASSFAYDVAGAGDLNLDGHADLLVSAFTAPPGMELDLGAYSLRAFVFFGSPGGLSLVPDWISPRYQDGGGFGSVAAPAGDINGDGFPDLLGGDRSYGPAGTLDFTGNAFLYLWESPSPGGTPSWSSSGDAQPGSHFGNDVAAAGDVNGDGYDDFLVAAWAHDTANMNAGKVYLFMGGSTATGVCDPGLACDDGNPCATGSTCDGDGLCVGLSWEPAGVKCDDGDPCTALDTCDGAGTCTGVLACSDAGTDSGTTVDSGTLPSDSGGASDAGSGEDPPGGCSCGVVTDVTPGAKLLPWFVVFGVSVLLTRRRHRSGTVAGPTSDRSATRTS